MNPRNAVQLVALWVMLTAIAGAVRVLTGWPWLLTSVQNDPGMAISTALCLIGVSVCILFLARLGK